MHRIFDRACRRRKHPVFPAAEAAHGGTRESGGHDRRHTGGQETVRVRSGDELLLARIENQLVRIQEMLDGRRREAEESRDEIQKLISEIAHQMRTPLAILKATPVFYGTQLKIQKREKSLTSSLRNGSSTCPRWKKARRSFIFWWTVL